MKRILLVAFSFVLFTSCEKAVEKVAEDMVMKAMTDGQWKIVSFTQNGTDITSTFSNYKFQYYSNKTVDAINGGSVEKTGAWDGNAEARTTWANFPNAGNPLLLINGTWQINDSGWTYVVASQTVGSETKTMRLEKI